MSAERVLAGRYRLREELGRGGMGKVWLAYDERLARDVAVKEVRAPDVLSERDVQHLHSRLEREAWAAGRIAHRNVVTVYDVVTEDGRPWIVMELVRGLSYDQVLGAEGPQPPERAAAVAAEVLAALRAAHSVGVLHRDVKPPNVLIGNDGRTVLTDFGIAVVEGSTHLTLTGQLVGSPEYLAPERAMGRAPGPSSDLWSLGVMLYAAVEGTVPFRYDSVLSTMRAIVEEQPRTPRHAGPLSPVIDGLLRKDPDERMPADEAARMLAITAEGGDPRDAEAALASEPPPPPAAYSPTVQSSDPWPVAQQTGTSTGALGAYGPPTYPSVPQPAEQPTGEQPVRRRRLTAWLLVAALVAALLVGGLVWALGRTTTGGEENSGGTSEGADGGGTSGGGQGGDTGGSGGGGGTEQRITAAVTAVRDSYTGRCPPPSAQAPSFRGTITVRKVPATVEYAWVTGSGTSYTAWKQLRFETGGPERRTVDHTETSHNPGGVRRDWIALKVRAPQQAESRHASFAITCADGDTYTPGPETSAPGRSPGTGTGGTGPGTPTRSGPVESPPPHTSTSPTESGSPSPPGTYGSHSANPLDGSTSAQSH